MHKTIFMNKAMDKRRFTPIISVLLVAAVFLRTALSEATTNVGTSGAQFLKI